MLDLEPDSRGGMKGVFNQRRLKFTVEGSWKQAILEPFDREVRGGVICRARRVWFQTCLICAV